MLEIVIIITTILLSMTVHEAMHAFASNWLGDDTALRLGRLTLNPLKHIDPFTTIIMPVLLYLSGLPPFGAAKPVPFNPYRLKYDEFGAAIVGLAGPLTNLFLAVVAGLWLRFVIGFDSGMFSTTFIMFVYVNIAFFVLNMIPFPPLDGSRLLYAFAPDGIRDLMASLERMGIMAIVLFFFVFYSFLSPLFIRAVLGLFSLITGSPLSI